MPSTSTDRLNGLSTSVAVKSPVVAVTSANITLSGLQTIGAVALAEGDRVLVKDQTDASENGIYDASTGNWTRAADFDGNRDVVKGTLVPFPFSGGTGPLYQVVTEDPITIGTSEIEFAIRETSGITYPLLPGVVGDATTDDRVALQNDIDTYSGTNIPIDIAGAEIRLTDTINFTAQHANIRGPGSIIIDHTGTAFARPSGTAARLKFDGIRVLAKQDAAIAFDMNQWQYCEFSRVYVGSYNGTNKFTRAFKLSNVAYWNVFHAIEVEAATIAFDLSDANDSYFFAPRHVRFSGVATNTFLFSGACSGVRVYAASMENIYQTAEVIKFHAGCEMCEFYGGRIEARATSSNVSAIVLNGSASNRLMGMYVLGSGVTSIIDTIGNNEVDIYSVSGRVRVMGSGYLQIPSSTSDPDAIARMLYHSADDKYKGYTTAGGARNFVQTPALEALNMNGFNVTGAGNVVVTAAASNPGVGAIAFGSTTASTANAGGASALPATPAGYLIINGAGTLFKIPYYAN